MQKKLHHSEQLQSYWWRVIDGVVDVAIRAALAFPKHVWRELWLGVEAQPRVRFVDAAEYVKQRLQIGPAAEVQNRFHEFGSAELCEKQNKY